MNLKRIATAVKEYLVALAVTGKLPMDLNELDLDALEVVVEAAGPTDEEKYLDAAGHYLSFENEEEEKAMIKAIAERGDMNDFIDDVEGVIVWEKVTYSFTCQQFLDQIGYVN